MCLNLLRRKTLEKKIVFATKETWPSHQDTCQEWAITSFNLTTRTLPRP